MDTIDSPSEPSSTALLAWYDRNRRDLPWRQASGSAADPYRIWLSEIMLQQTTVATVKSYYRAFLNRWPTVTALAAAPIDDVLHAWQGLGYYARARNLHRCAVVVANDHGGVFPQTEAALLALPGVGAYTAAAIAAIAFDLKATVVDGNVERVISRLYAITAPRPGSRPEIQRRAAGLTPDQRAGDHAQAMMDLGATLCTPRAPKCILCPWLHVCAARRLGIAETLPTRTEKPVKPTRFGVVFWITRSDGAVMLRRRPETGLLGGMIEIPSTDWRSSPDWTMADWTNEDAARLSPADVADWTNIAGLVKHTFTHFHLELRVIAGRTNRPPNDAFWALPDEARLSGEESDDFAAHALPTVMKKIIKLVAKSSTAATT